MTNVVVDAIPTPALALTICDPATFPPPARTTSSCPPYDKKLDAAYQVS